MKTRKHKNNKLFSFDVIHTERVNETDHVIRLGRKCAVGSCWPSVKKGLLFGTDRQYEFHNVTEVSMVNLYN